ncbi:MAG: hypothetical protein ACK4OP_16240 [Gemmobacter sp.]
MTWDALFSACSTLALVGSAVLILALRPFLALPRWGIPAALSADYAALVMAHFADAGIDDGRGHARAAAAHAGGVRG